METYTIGEAAKRADMTTHTLRFYDKQGMLPFVDRDPSGNRIFKESDFRWLSLIHCFKKTGMSIKQIKHYIEWCMAGDSTLQVRLDTMREHRQSILDKIDELEQLLDTVDYKVRYYEAAVEAGTEAIHHLQPANTH